VQRTEQIEEISGKLVEIEKANQNQETSPLLTYRHPAVLQK